MLPVGIYTEFYWTVNARRIMNFLGLRNHETAQREIRAYAARRSRSCGRGTCPSPTPRSSRTHAPRRSNADPRGPDHGSARRRCSRCARPGGRLVTSFGAARSRMCTTQVPDVCSVAGLEIGRAPTRAARALLRRRTGRRTSPSGTHVCLVAERPPRHLAHQVVALADRALRSGSARAATPGSVRTRPSRKPVEVELARSALGERAAYRFPSVYVGK